MKYVIACMLFVVSAIAEPPVDNSYRYLPPQQGGRLGAPSSSYGAPGSNGSQRQTSAVFGGRQSSYSPRTAPRLPSSQYGAPNSFSGGSSSFGAAPSSQYGAPSAAFGGAPSSQYGAPSSSFGGAPSTQYGAPSSSFGAAPSSQYGAPSASLGAAPSSQYGAPSAQYGAPDANARQPSSQYGAPSSGSRGFGQAAPSQQYGAPGFGGGSQGVEQSRQYLPPGGSGGYGADDGSNGEPANYSFEYMVKDEPSGNDFGHRESRQGDRAEGLYYVLLPDGRKQTVEYEADQDGYKPRISYEDVGAGAGYPGAQGYGNQGQGYGNEGQGYGNQGQGGPY